MSHSMMFNPCSGHIINLVWYDYIRMEREPPLSFVGSTRLDGDIEKVAAVIRKALGLDLEKRGAPRTWTDTLHHFVHVADMLGILVMVSGIVRGNTRRKLDPGEFRGFTLVDDHAPLIFISGADTKTEQMFTLAHELAHLWLGQTALSNPTANTVPDHEVEAWCDRVAAELLVPLAVLCEEYRQKEELSQALTRLAHRLKVSTLVVLRRIRDLGGSAIPVRNSFLALSVPCRGSANFFSWTFRTGSAILRTDRQKPSRKMSRDSLRKHLSMPGMLRAVRACLHRIADPTDTRGISLSDCLMSGLAVFPSRTLSLLQSGRQVRGLTTVHTCIPDSMRLNGGACRSVSAISIRTRLPGSPGRSALAQRPRWAGHSGAGPGAGGRLARGQPAGHARDPVAGDRTQPGQGAEAVRRGLRQQPPGRGGSRIGRDDPGDDGGQRQAALPAGGAVEDAIQAGVAGGSQDGGGMAVRQGTLDVQQVADVGDGDGTLQDGPEAPADRQRQLRQVGDGPPADALPLAPGLAEEDGGLSGLVGDRFDVEGHGGYPLWEPGFPP